MSVNGVKSLAIAAIAALQLPRSSRLGADKRFFRARGALGRRRHAAVGDARFGDPSAVEREAERAHHGGNVLVEALGDLERAIGLVRGETRRDERAHIFAA